MGRGWWQTLNVVPPPPVIIRAASISGALTGFKLLGLTLYVAYFISPSPMLKELIFLPHFADKNTSVQGGELNRPADQTRKLRN